MQELRTNGHQARIERVRAHVARNLAGDLSLDRLAGVVVAPGTRLPPEADRLRMPGGRVAVLLHKGAYAGIAGTWDACYRWLGASGESEADAPCHDLYLNGPGDTAPEDLLTELCIPLKGREGQIRVAIRPVTSPRQLRCSPEVRRRATGCAASSTPSLTRIAATAASEARVAPSAILSATPSPRPGRMAT